MAIRRVLVLTGGGDCPGLNAVIRAIVKKATGSYGWEVLGSLDSFNGILRDPMELRTLDAAAVAGIHVQGGTILGTTNRGGPFAWPVTGPDGRVTHVDRSDELIRRLHTLQIDAVINIGGDGSQRISQGLFEKGVPIVGVPKTIDNDLSATDVSFGYQTAVEIATDAVDKLVTTASSHNRIMVLEVMGRDAGWIGLAAAVAGGADVALIPEIPYDTACLFAKVEERRARGRGFAIVVVAEGALRREANAGAERPAPAGARPRVAGDVGRLVAEQIQQRFPHVETRLTVLGHLQRGGGPCAYDRILATQLGVGAVDLVAEGKFGYMVAARHLEIVPVLIKDAIARYKHVDLDGALVRTARALGICLGD